MVGVDINAQPRYPFDFFQADAVDFLRDYLDCGDGPFQAVHASPPCQRWSEGARQKDGSHFRQHPDLIGITRQLLEAIGVPYIIENIPSAPLLCPFILCGTQFEGLRVIRHRAFEVNWHVGEVPSCGARNKRDLSAHPPVLHPYDMRRKNRVGDEWSSFLSITGGGHASLAAASDAMGIDWMVRRELVQAIPPAYTRFIGERLIERL